MDNVDLTTIRGIEVLIACDFCEEKGRVKGGRYASEGEVIDCPCCNGRKTTRATIDIPTLQKLVVAVRPTRSN